MFNIPVKNLHEDLFCSIPKNGQCADLLHATKAIIWDEIEAQHRHAVETLDWTLQDICNDEQLFRGITVILGGNFFADPPCCSVRITDENCQCYCPTFLPLGTC